jgi:hypothetical protein
VGTPASFRQGQIFWIECPPIDGGAPKTRPVLLISTRAEIESSRLLRVVVGTTTPEREGLRDFDKVEAPSRATNPRAATNLSERTWFLPRWRFPIGRERLNMPSTGYLSGSTLKRVMEAVLLRNQESSLPPAGRSDQ